MTTVVTTPERRLYDQGAFILRANPDKSPAETKGYMNQPRPEWDAIQNHLTEGGNVALVPWSLRMGVIDVDVKNGHKGLDSLDAMEHEIGELPEGMPRVETPSGGMHIYGRIPDECEDIGNATNFRDGLDFKCNGGYVLMPPSAGYTWLEEPGDDIPEIPMEWIKAAGVMRKSKPEPANPEPENMTASHMCLAPRREKAYAQQALKNGAAEIAGEPEGGRDDKLNKVAFHMGTMVVNDWISRDQVEASLFDAALDSGLPEGEARATIKSGIKAGIKKPHSPLPDRGQPITAPGGSPDGMLAYSELEAAEMLARDHGADIRHQTGLGWHWWNGCTWEPGEKPVEALVQKVAKKIHAAAVHAFDQGDEGRAKTLMAWSRAIGKANGTRGVMSMARSMKGINADKIDFDAHDWLLTVQNGTIDLSTGTLLPHNREHYITRACPWAYDPKAKCSRWLESLYQWMDDSEDMVEYLQWLCGYCLTGSTRYHLFPVAYGGTRTGKSTFIRAMQTLLGPSLAHQADPEIFMVQPLAQHSTDKAALMGKRFVAAIETTASRRLDEAFVKALTGGDRIRARFMRQDSFEFRPQCKVLLATNERPRITDDSGAVWARLRLIPFDVSFVGRENRNLDTELEAEMPGILRWAVEGAKRASEGEPPVPARVQAGVADYRETSDSLAQFIHDECTEGEHLTVPKGRFYASYRDWTGGHCGSQWALSERMKRRGYTEVRRGARGDRVWKGLCLNCNQDIELCN